MKKVAIVALGGTLGSFTRYLFTESIARYSLAILIVNLIGVAIAGMVAYRIRPSELSETFWIPGFAGGFTTFSSVAVIYNSQSPVTAFGYFFATVIISLMILAFIQPKQRT